MSTTSSIGSGKTYSSIAAFHAAFATGGWIGQKYGETTESFNFTGASTSAVNYIRLEAAPGEGVSAITSSGPLRYDGTKGGAVKDNTGYGGVFFFNEDYVTLSGLQITELATNAGYAINNNSASCTNCVIENCLIEQNSTSATAVVLWRTGLMRNTLIVNRTSNGHGIDLSYAFPTFANCTIARPSDKGGGGDGFHNGGSGSVVAKNTAVFGFSTFATSGLTLTGSDYNCSDKTIAVGTHNQASKTYSSQFQNSTDVTRDFRTKSGADLLNNGVTDTTDIPNSVDIIGTSRPQGASWDIGAWELVTSVSYALTAAQGAFAYSGKAAGLYLGRKVVGAVGSFAYSGKAVGLLYARKFSVAVAAFALSGQAAGLYYGRKVPAAVGTIAFSGKSVGLLAARIFSVATGAFSFIGQGATLNKGRLLIASQGAFSFTGQAAGLSAVRKIAAGLGAFSFTGQSSGLFKGRTLAASQGSFGLSGQSARLLFTRRFAAIAGGFGFTGQNVGLNYGHRGVSASGSFAYSGLGASLRATRDFPAATGVFAFTGNPAILVATGIKRLASMRVDVRSGSVSLDIGSGTVDVSISSSPAAL